MATLNIDLVRYFVGHDDPLSWAQTWCGTHQGKRWESFLQSLFGSDLERFRGEVGRIFHNVGSRCIVLIGNDPLHKQLLSLLFRAIGEQLATTIHNSSEIGKGAHRAILLNSDILPLRLVQCANAQVFIATNNPHFEVEGSIYSTFFVHSSHSDIMEWINDDVVRAWIVIGALQNSLY